MAPLDDRKGVWKKAPGKGRRTPKGRQVEDKALEDIRALLGDRPRRRDLLIEFLHLVQDAHGHLSAAQLRALADEMRLAQAEVYEVATFYSMFQTKPVGRHNVAICTNISCMLRGADDIVEHVEAKLGVKLGESTEDGRIFLKQEEECLAACCGAPMMMVDHKYHENLSKEQVDKILDALE